MCVYDEDIFRQCVLNVCVRVVWQGLVVPVIRGVEGMNFADIEKTINELGEKVRCP